MHDAFGVRVGERARELREDAQRVGDRKRALPADRDLEVGPGHVLHREVERARLQAACVEDLDDARMP